MGHVIREKIMELHARQMQEEKMLCPGCGGNTMRYPMEENPFSRYIDGIRFCQNCAEREAECADVKNVILDNVREWWFLRGNILPDCFEKDSPGEAAARIEEHIVPRIIQLYYDWEQGKIDNEDFEVLVLTTIPGANGVRIDETTAEVYFKPRNHSLVIVSIRYSEENGVEYAIRYTNEHPDA